MPAKHNCKDTILKRLMIIINGCLNEAIVGWIQQFAILYKTFIRNRRVYDHHQSKQPPCGRVSLCWSIQDIAYTSYAARWVTMHNKNGSLNCFTFLCV